MSPHCSIVSLQFWFQIPIADGNPMSLGSSQICIVVLLIAIAAVILPFIVSVMLAAVPS